MQQPCCILPAGSCPPAGRLVVEELVKIVPSSAQRDLNCPLCPCDELTPETAVLQPGLLVPRPTFAGRCERWREIKSGAWHE
jgi:hypothetical protein